MTARTEGYIPLQNGIPNDIHNVRYVEYTPSDQLSDVVAVFWELKSAEQLRKDFIYTVMPDACIDIVFDVATPKNPPLLMTPHVSIEKLTLGKSFHYAGIRFKPGVFTQSMPDSNRIVGERLTVRSFNDIDLQPLCLSLARATNEGGRLALLTSFCSLLRERGYISKNPVIDYVVTGLYAGKTVEEIAQGSGYSPRQLRRLTKQQTGYTPVQLHRVLRFQAALSDDSTKLRFADESHLIKEFRRITGDSYRHFVKKFK